MGKYFLHGLCKGKYFLPKQKYLLHKVLSKGGIASIGARYVLNRNNKFNIIQTMLQTSPLLVLQESRISSIGGGNLLYRLYKGTCECLPPSGGYTSPLRRRYLPIMKRIENTVMEKYFPRTDHRRNTLPYGVGTYLSWKGYAPPINLMEGRAFALCRTHTHTLCRM